MEPPNTFSRPFNPATANMNERQQFHHHNSRTKISTLNPEKIYFPEKLPSPTDLPFRPPPQIPKLDELEKIHGKFPPPLEILGNKPEAVSALNKHIDARQNFVEFASARLQAAVGVRNDTTFELPQLPKGNLSPSMQGLYGIPMAGFASSALDRGGMKAKAHARGGRKDGGIGFVPKSPVGMQNVDQKTGKGLREFLLQRRRDCGMRKRECKSITFHDFTPDMRSGLHQNVMLGHYAVEVGERVDVYEVDLPVTQRNQVTGEDYAATETWLWILISRPVVSIDFKDTSTYVPPSTGSPATDVFYTPQPTTSSPEPMVAPTPPNFPHPTPISWCVFAAPSAHVTTYPETLETHDGDGSIAKYPFANPSATIHKRIDYDFSFSGIPLFEFSSPLSESSSVGTATAAKQPAEFLSVEQMGGFYTTDRFEPYSTEDYERHCRLWEAGEWPPGKQSGGSTSSPYEDDGTPKGAVPAPNRGVWWTTFYERMAKDAERWKKIKGAMGRGKCRVVVRWSEAPEDESMEEEGEGDVDVSGKRVCGAAGKKRLQGSRRTRVEGRRRLDLDGGELPLGLAIGGVVGAGKFGKTRVLGSSELGGAAGGVVDKEKAHVRKR